MAEPASPLAAPLSPRDRFRQDIRRIATYSADEGTCGYLLTEAQFAAIGRAADWYADEHAAALVEQAARTPASQRGRHVG